MSSVIQEWRTALYCQKCWCESILIFQRDTGSCQSSVKIKKAAVDWVIGAGDEGRFVGTQEQGQGGDFFGVGHAADVVCDASVDPRDLIGRAAVSICRSEAIATAMPQVKAAVAAAQQGRRNVAGLPAAQ